MAFDFLQKLSADDIFISYARRDASTYAAGLADELTKLGFSCFIDTLGTDPNEDLPDSLRQKIRSCSMLVVVGTASAVKRQTIKEEVAEFVSAGRTSVVPIDFGDTVYDADWYKPIHGIAPEPETNPNALDDGNPSPAVVSRINKQFNYRRRDERLRRTTRRAIAVLACLLIAITVAAGIAWQQLARAAAATAKADDETARATQATRDAQQAQDAARIAKEQADTARVEATKQRDEATKQKAVADDAIRTAAEKTRLAEEAANRAKESEARAYTEQARAERQAVIADIRAGANRSQSYLRQSPEDVRVSLSYALNALKTAERISVRNADADAALRESLALVPLRRGRVRLGVLTKVALSPDGLQYATVVSKTLRVYATPDGNTDGAMPLLERPCDCKTIALAGGLTRAAAVLDGERGFKIFDLKDDSRSIIFESVKGARGEKITSAVKLALSPDGQYFALYTYEGDGDGNARHSKLVVIDAASGEPVRVYDDDAPGGVRADDLADGLTGKLNMRIWDIAFGPTGNLAIVGNRPGTSENRVVVWKLAAKAPTTGARPKLTADSFDRYEVIPQEGPSFAIAPGADDSYFATDEGVWKKSTWQTRFDPVVRIPSTADGSFSVVRSMAFRAGGKSVALARIAPHRSDAGGKFEIVVEVWDAAGHTDVAEAFHTKEVAHVGFEPGGRLVATATEYASKNLVDGPLGENRAHRLRVYHADTGAEVKVTAEEPTDVDRSVFYVGPGAAQIVTLSGDTVQVWDVWAKDEAKRKRVVSFGKALNSLEAVALSPGGRFLALAGWVSDGMRVIICRSDGGDDYVELKRLGLGQMNLKLYEGLMLSADGRRLVVFNRDDQNPLRIYDDGVENTTLRERLDGLSHVSTVALSANGRYLTVSGYLDDTSAFWLTGHTWLLDISEGSWERLLNDELVETILDDELVTSVTFSPDSAYVAVGTGQGVLHVFETKRAKDEGGAEGDTRRPKEEIARLQHAGKVTAVAFSDDGKYVATASSQPRPYMAGEPESYPLCVWLLRPADLIAESERRLGVETLPRAPTPTR